MPAGTLVAASMAATAGGSDPVGTYTAPLSQVNPLLRERASTSADTSWSACSDRYRYTDPACSVIVVLSCSGRSARGSVGDWAGAIGTACGARARPAGRGRPHRDSDVAERGRVRGGQRVGGRGRVDHGDLDDDREGVG